MIFGVLLLYLYKIYFHNTAKNFPHILNFYSKHVSYWCQKKKRKKRITFTVHFSAHFLFLKSTFSKHLENKYLYISVYLGKKIYVPKTWEAFI